jgi:hypothetical protein
MKKLSLIFSIFIFASCGQKETNTKLESPAKTNIVSKNNKKIKFNKIKGKAILLGDNIKLLDENFNEIMDISFLNEQFVNITEVSDKYHKFKPNDDYCQEFKYVKVKTKGIEGYVDGKKLYAPIKHIQNKIVTIDNNQISLIATHNFGIGVSDDSGLTYCSVKTPAIFSDKIANYEGLVKMIRNKYYDEEYPYFELKDDDGANDQIESIVKQKDKYLLKINRTLQEGSAKLLVAIGKDLNENFAAEILEYEITIE